MSLLKESHKAKLLEMFHIVYPKWGIEFKHTFESKSEHTAGMNYLTITTKHGSFDTTLDKLILIHMMPDLHKLIAAKDGNRGNSTWKVRYLESIAEFFGNALYDTTPNTLIDFTYEVLFDEIMIKPNNNTQLSI